MKLAFGIGGLIRRNLRHYWRTNLPVALGCAVAVAALVGSLLVGDSVRGSLHDLAIERLGRVEYAVQSPGFFREQLAADILAQPQAKGAADFAVPAILAMGAAKSAEGGAVVNRVNVIGIPPEFRDIAVEPFGPPPQERRIVVNSTLAADLTVSPGDAVLLTLGREQDAPTDSIFMRRSRAQTTRTLRLVVERIIPSRGIGTFSLRQEPAPPRNLYVSLEWLQAQLKAPAQANTILIGRRATQGGIEGQTALAEALDTSWRLADCGLRLRPNPEFGYLALQSGQILLPPAAAARAESIAAELGMNCRPSSVELDVGHGRQGSRARNPLLPRCGFGSARGPCRAASDGRRRRASGARRRGHTLERMGR